MQNGQVKLNRRRSNDFPEHQVGYPERNDVRFPHHDTERIHVDPETLRLSRKSADELSREIREEQVSRS